MVNANWVFLISFLVPLIFPSWGTPKTFQGRVIKVFDGDTFLVQVQGRKEYVRLREIDAPEITSRQQVGQEPWGKRARTFARSWVKDKTLRLEVEEKDERDLYHRLLGYVFVGDVLVNLELVRSGNAFFYSGPIRGRYASQLEKAENAARERGLGVWDRENGLRERPQEFRSRTHRKEGNFPKFRGLPPPAPIASSVR